MKTYPEHKKLKAALPDARIVKAFLGWLEDQGLVIEDPSGERLTVVASDLLHEYFGIDRSRLDDEKREMLDDAARVLRRHATRQNGSR